MEKIGEPNPFKQGRGRDVGRDKRGSNRERWFREWIGQSYENAVGYCLYTMSFKENPFTAEPGSGPCPRYSNGSHSYRSNCRYRPCHWQDPIIPRADIVTWKRWQLPIHFSDVFISPSSATDPYSIEITRSPWSCQSILSLLVLLTPLERRNSDGEDF